MPLVAWLNARLVGTTHRDDENSLSRIFDRLISIGARSRIEEGLCNIARAMAGANSDDILSAMSLNVLGTDTLAGTLAVSLHDEIAASPPRLLSEIEFSRSPASTSVPFVGRVAAADIEVLGTSFRAGDAIRVYLLPFADNAAEADAVKLFGAGRHVCIGKRLSQIVWAEMTARLGEVQRRARVVDFRLRCPDYLFVFPNRLEVELA